MRKEELERRSAEMKARMLAQRVVGRESTPPVDGDSRVSRRPGKPVHASPEAALECFRIEKPHPLILSTQRRIKEKHTPGPILHLGGAEGLDISVERGSVARSLWFMQCLVTRCASAGIQFTLSPTYPIATTAVVDDMRMQVRVREKTNRIEKHPSEQEANRRQIHEPRYWSREYEYSPSGIVYFEILNWQATRKRWVIPATPPMDECLESILTNLRETARALKRIEQDRREQETLQRELERRRIEERQKQDREAKRVEELRRMAKEWDESARLCAFLDAFEKHVSGLGCDLSSDSGTGQWLTWAREYAMKLNPIERTSMDEAGTGDVVISRI